MPIIGIDLGTSNSAAAVLRGGRPVTIPSTEGITLGGKAFPSYVAITADGQMLVGEPARRQAAANPEGTATGFKRQKGPRTAVRLEEADSEPAQTFSAGEQVRHPQFGDGIVVSCEPSGGDYQVVVAFQGEAGIKKLLLSFAPLEKVSA